MKTRQLLCVWLAGRIAFLSQASPSSSSWGALVNFLHFFPDTWVHHRNATTPVEMVEPDIFLNESLGCIQPRPHIHMAIGEHGFWVSFLLKVLYMYFKLKRAKLYRTHNQFLQKSISPLSFRICQSIRNASFSRVSSEHVLCFLPSTFDNIRGWLEAPW